MADLRYDFSWHINQQNRRELDILLRDGTFKPVFLYQVILFNCLPWFALIIPKRNGGKYLRQLVFGLSVAFVIESLKDHRVLLGGNGYVVGLTVSWWLVWSATLLVFSDIEDDFQRIERVPLTGKAATHKDQQIQLHWQSYPSSISHRLEWCAGLLFNLRGPEWNWRVPRLGRMPREVYEPLKSGFLSSDHVVEDAKSRNSARKCMTAALRTFLLSYLMLDGLKVLLMMDPYFRGTASPDAQPPFPFSSFAFIPFGIRFYHCFLSCMGVYVALLFVTSFNPICFLGLSLAFPNASRKLTAAPLDAPWLYADAFGSFISPTLDHGLAGTWGRWWHQLFRHGFTTAARWLISLLPGTWRANAGVKRIVHIFVAFGLSGFLHACGSYTQFTKTAPLTGPFLFFQLQGIAIIFESIFKTVVFPMLPLDWTPRWLRRTANGIFVFCWLLYSGPLIADDFARGGIWLMEPVPFSPLRGLGLGGGQAWCWQGSWFEYWSDGTYWGSGLRVI